MLYKRRADIVVDKPCYRTTVNVFASYSLIHRVRKKTCSLPWILWTNFNVCFTGLAHIIKM